MSRSSVHPTLLLLVLAAAASPAAAQLTRGPVADRSLQPAPGQVRPSSGGVGTEIRIWSDFDPFLAAGFRAVDVLAVNDEVEDEQFFFGRCEALAPSNAKARIARTSPFARPSPVALVFGSGAETQVPSLDGVVFYPEPLWSWQGPLAGASVVTGNELTCPPRFIDLSCDDPPTTIQAPFRLDPDGCLRATLPGDGSCLDDKLSFHLAFQTTDRLVALDMPPSTALGKSPWNVASLYVVFPLNVGLNAAGSGCSASFVGGEIVICPDPGVAITDVLGLSAVTIELSPAQHTLFVGGNGDPDYLPGGIWDPTMPDPAFQAMAGKGTFGDGYRDYDDQQYCDQYFLDTVDNVMLAHGDIGSEAVDGPIRSAVLQIRIKGFGCQTNTDGISFGWDGDPLTPQMEWGYAMIDLAELAYSWNPGDDAILCFDLGALPPRNGTLQSILDVVSARDLVDVRVADDTMVSYVELRVLRCNP